MSKQPPPAPTESAIGPCPTVIQTVGRPGTGSLPSTIAPPDHPSERGRKKKEMIDDRKNVQTTPSRTYCKRSRPLPYSFPNKQDARYWKVTQHHRTTRPPERPFEIVFQSISGRVPKRVGCLGFSGPLRQYFSLYRAVSQREGGRGEKGKRRVNLVGWLVVLGLTAL